MILRRASPDDFAAFFLLKSEPDNIFWAGHAGPPDRERLRTWYAEALAQRVILIAEEKATVVGYAYLMIDNDRVEASVSVFQALTGRGYGRRIIARAAEMARDIFPGLPVIAWIFPQNLASVRAHEAAGYAHQPGEERRSTLAADPSIGIQACWVHQQ